VFDLQRRLAALDLPCIPDPEGLFGPGTAAALEAFQHRRGLRVDGICGRQTWSALVEAGFRVGDRFLYLRRPMLRGDDVADLQRRLSALGFDTGRVDGIFGVMTSSALADFQRNVGLAPDAILGASTLRELRRVMPPHAEPELVSSVRDRERLRTAPRTLLGRRVAVGEEGGLDVLVGAVRRRLTESGAQVVPLLHPDGSVQAGAANAAAVEAYLGLRLVAQDERCIAAYYAGYSYESQGGRHLAELVQRFAAEALGIKPGGAVGMSLPVLRETRMPAVICEVGPPALVVQRTQQLARALVDALEAWVVSPVQ
jgi:N-acetylmuramoyl-L-alanine amidase